MKHPELYRAYKLTLPIMIVWFPLGIVFGLLCKHLGFAWELGPIMSAVIYGGSVQFVALGMMKSHGGYFAILLATVFISLRNSFYGLSFLKRFDTHWLLKAFLIFGLVDGAYATLASNPPRTDENDIKFCFYVTLLIYLSWLSGTLMGAVFSNFLPMFSGFEFVLPCFFMVLTIECFLATRSIFSLIVPVIAAIFAYLIMPDNYLIFAIILSVISIYFVYCRMGIKDA